MARTDILTVMSTHEEHPMPNANLKQTAHQLIDKLPENATWDDLMRQIYERQAIERGLVDSDANRVKDVKDVRAKYNLPE